MDNKDRTQYLVYRKKRVKRIKTIMLFICALFIIMPSIMCVVLFSKLSKLETALCNLENQVLLSQEEEVTSKAFSTDSVIIPNTTEELVKVDKPDGEKYAGYTRVYLTFDDGPTDYTNEVLDTLNEYGIKATFFCLAMEGRDDEYNRIVNEGHTLAIHSYTHNYSEIYGSLDAFKADVSGMSDYLYNITGVRPKFYRFPGGSSNNIAAIDKNEMFDFLSNEGLTYFDWNVSSGDAVAGGLSTNQIVNNIISGINEEGESVVLMHDSAYKSTTVEALPIVIEKLMARGNVVFLPITENTEPVQHVLKGE